MDHAGARVAQRRSHCLSRSRSARRHGGFSVGRRSRPAQDDAVVGLEVAAGLAWSRGGDEVWFTGSRTGKGGSSALYAVTLSGRERTVFSSPARLKLNDISRDGQRVLLTRGTTRGGIMVRSGGQRSERDLSWLDYSTVADLSADGKTLLFYEWGEGVGATPTVFLRKTDGSDAVRLGEGRPLALSPDARWVVAVQGNRSQNCPAAGGHR